jgi:hypothetical protein
MTGARQTLADSHLCSGMGRTADAQALPIRPTWQQGGAGRVALEGPPDNGLLLHYRLWVHPGAGGSPFRHWKARL